MVEGFKNIKHIKKNDLEAVKAAVLALQEAEGDLAAVKKNGPKLTEEKKEAKKSDLKGRRGENNEDKKPVELSESVSPKEGAPEEGTHDSATERAIDLSPQIAFKIESDVIKRLIASSEIAFEKRLINEKQKKSFDLLLEKEVPGWGVPFNEIKPKSRGKRLSREQLEGLEKLVDLLGNELNNSLEEEGAGGWLRDCNLMIGETNLLLEKEVNKKRPSRKPHEKKRQKTKPEPKAQAAPDVDYDGLYASPAEGKISDEQISHQPVKGAFEAAERLPVKEEKNEDLELKKQIDEAIDQLEELIKKIVIKTKSASENKRIAPSEDQAIEALIKDGEPLFIEYNERNYTSELLARIKEYYLKIQQTTDEIFLGMKIKLKELILGDSKEEKKVITKLEELYKEYETLVKNERFKEISPELAKRIKKTERKIWYFEQARNENLKKGDFNESFKAAIDKIKNRIKAEIDAPAAAAKETDSLALVGKKAETVKTIEEKISADSDNERKFVPYTESCELAANLLEKYKDRILNEEYDNADLDGVLNSNNAIQKFLDRVPKEILKKYSGHGITKGDDVDQLAAMINIAQNKCIIGAEGNLVDVKGNISSTYTKGAFLVVSKNNEHLLNKEHYKIKGPKPLEKFKGSLNLFDENGEALALEANIGAVIINLNFYPMAEELKRLFPDVKIIKANEIPEFFENEKEQKETKGDANQKIDKKETKEKLPEQVFKEGLEKLKAGTQEFYDELMGVIRDNQEEWGSVNRAEQAEFFTRKLKKFMDIFIREKKLSVRNSDRIAASKFFKGEFLKNLK